MTATAFAPTSTRPQTVQGTLALDILPRTDPPRPHGTRVGSGADIVDIATARRRQVESWAARFAQAAVEIVGGDRPVSQLVRWTSEQVFSELERRAQLIARAGGALPGTRRLQPVRPRVHSVRTCFLGTEVVESAVHLHYGPRSRAIALRLERRTDRWICTALEWA
ncbi:MAG: Rv3235 family protein [Nocardioides sp.]